MFDIYSLQSSICDQQCWINTNYHIYYLKLAFDNLLQLMSPGNPPISIPFPSPRH